KGTLGCARRGHTRRRDRVRARHDPRRAPSCSRQGGIRPRRGARPGRRVLCPRCSRARRTAPTWARRKLGRPRTGRGCRRAPSPWSTNSSPGKRASASSPTFRGLAFNATRRRKVSDLRLFSFDVAEIVDSSTTRRPMLPVVVYVFSESLSCTEARVKPGGCLFHAAEEQTLARLKRGWGSEPPCIGVVGRRRHGRVATKPFGDPSTADEDSALPRIGCRYRGFVCQSRKVVMVEIRVKLPGGRVGRASNHVVSRDDTLQPILDGKDAEKRNLASDVGALLSRQVRVRFEGRLHPASHRIRIDHYLAKQGIGCSQQHAPALEPHHREVEAHREEIVMVTFAAERDRARRARRGRLHSYRFRRERGTFGPHESEYSERLDHQESRTAPPRPGDREGPHATAWSRPQAREVHQVRTCSGETLPSTSEQLVGCPSHR